MPVLTMIKQTHIDAGKEQINNRQKSCECKKFVIFAVATRAVALST